MCLELFPETFKKQENALFLQVFWLELRLDKEGFIFLTSKH